MNDQLDIGDREEATLAALKAYREVIDGLVERYEGRVFGSAGDSVIAEFASPVEAVRCAVAIQRELGNRNNLRNVDERMHFRIGVNLRDVIVEHTNLYGDRVNVAARRLSLRQSMTKRAQTWRMAVPLSLRKSAIVL